MKRLSISCVIFYYFLQANLCYADPIITFEKTFGGSKDDEGLSVVQIIDGGYIICSGIRVSIVGPSRENIYLIKTDKHGNKLWEKTFGGKYGDKGYSVNQTDDGGYIICGVTESFGSGGSDVYLIKTDSQGNVAE